MKIALACVALAFAVPTVAVAAEDASVITRHERVSFVSDDAETLDGAKKTYEQLRRAARRVCSSPLRSPIKDRVDLDCAREALDRAVADIAIPQVSALHTGQAAPVQLAARAD
jgi:UrcA family protein